MTTTTDLLRRAAGFLREWDEQTGGCDHGVGICNCDWRQTANDLLALADSMERVEPVAWTLTETLANKETTTRANLWFSDPVNSAWSALYTHPAPEVTRDAERYRWLRADHPYSSVYKGEPFIGQQLIGNTGRMVGDHADKAIDKAMAAMQEPKP